MLAHDRLHQRRDALEQRQSPVGLWPILQMGESFHEGVRGSRHV